MTAKTRINQSFLGEFVAILRSVATMNLRMEKSDFASLRMTGKEAF